ncbi:uncharacterized protein LOC120834460 [Gasterosteus aculeatus]
MNMKTLALFSLSLAVALGMSPLAPGVEHSPELSPMLGDLLPVQGHVVVEEPAPQVRPGSEEKKEELSPKHSGEVLEIREKPQVGEEPGGEVSAEIKKEPDVEAGPDVKEDLEAEVEPEVHLNPEVMVKVNADAEPEVEMALIDLEGKLETGQDLEERHIDMEGKYGMGEPIMELEPLEEDSMQFSQVENHLMAAFQNHNSVSLPLANRSDIDYEEPIMELEPEEVGQQVMPRASIVEEGEKRSSVGLPEMEGHNSVALRKQPLRQGVKNPEETRPSPNQDNEGKSHCPGVLLHGTCYQFFTGPKTASDAEFFCQEHFAAGHLASITGQRIHREVMNMMLQQNGFLTRTWIGGLRYLKTGRFIWLDGSHWSYADWLWGEPNNTSNLEDCVEVLPRGKFNDFTCWEAQPFICSYPFQ